MPDKKATEWLDQNLRSDASPKFKALEITTGPVTIAGSAISSTELAYLDGLTIGTVAGSKAVVVSADKDIGDFRNLDAVNIDAGASGVAGSIDVYPTTASRGKISITAQSHASGDLATTITNATDLSVAAIVTLPNATCTLPGVGLANTFTAAQTVAIDDAATNTVTDVLTLKHTTSGTAAADLGIGVSVVIENLTDATTEVASLDFVATEVTKATMDVDAVIKTMLGGTVTQVLKVDASEQSVDIGVNATDADGIYRLKVFPVTASKGALVLSAVANTGDTNVIITNAAHGQQSTVTIPDPGASTANFLLSAGAQLVGGAQTLTAGAGTAAVALRFGATATEGLEVMVYDAVTQLTNAAFTNTTCVIPAGAVLLSVQANLAATITGDASGDDLLATVGIGVSGGDEDKYGDTASLLANQKISTVPDWAVNAGETLAIFALKADRNTACTEKFTGGAGQNVRVRVVYLQTNDLDNA